VSAQIPKPKSDGRIFATIIAESFTSDNTGFILVLNMVLFLLVFLTVNGNYDFVFNCSVSVVPSSLKCRTPVLLPKW
jgi:hypothetical protein